jgi:two-component system, NarL family, sensor kinase
MRVSGDLHDELGPILSAIKFKLGSIEIHNPDDEIQMKESVLYINDIIIRLREISNDLMPVTLLSKGLVTATREFIHKIPLSTGLAIHLKPGNIPELKKETSINLYRIIQEITHNTIKHAEASQLDISIESIEKNLIITTSDNGKGFDYSFEKEENTGLGLRNLLSRTDIMNGNLFIESIPGKGTNYIIEIPIN